MTAHVAAPRPTTAHHTDAPLPVPPAHSRADHLAPLVLALTVATAVLAYAATAPNPIGIDATVLDWMAGHRVAWLTPLMIAVSTIFAPVPAIGLALVVATAVTYVRRDISAGLVILGSSAITMTLVVALKLAIHRDRPPMWAQLMNESDPSFPSGHVAGILILTASTLTVLWPDLSKTGRRLGVLVGSALVTLVAASRIYVGAHWTTDVLAGLTLAAATALTIPPALTHHIPTALTVSRTIGARR